jgi:hypothetical protein
VVVEIAPQTSVVGVVTAVKVVVVVVVVSEMVLVVAVVVAVVLDVAALLVALLFVTGGVKRRRTTARSSGAVNDGPLPAHAPGPQARSPCKNCSTNRVKETVRVLCGVVEAVVVVAERAEGSDAFVDNVEDGNAVDGNSEEAEGKGKEALAFGRG